MHADWNKVWKAIPVHHWEESTCGTVRLQPFGKHWHQKLDEDDVDDTLEHTITTLEQKLRVLAGKLDDAREMRRNQILSRIDHFPEGMSADPHFQRIFSLYVSFHLRSCGCRTMLDQYGQDTKATTSRGVVWCGVAWWVGTVRRVLTCRRPCDLRMWYEIPRQV